MANEHKTNPTTEKTNTLNPTARRNARRYALQAMYQWQLAETALQEIELDFLQNQIYME